MGGGSETRGLKKREEKMIKIPIEDPDTRIALKFSLSSNF